MPFVAYLIGGVIDKLVTIQVPIPPSANHIHAYAKGRVRRSKNYEIWLTQCRYLLGRPGAVPGVVTVEIVVIGGKGWRANRDLDNIIKPILDLLRHLGIIEEDNTGIVHGITITFKPPAEKSAEASVTITVKGIA